MISVIQQRSTAAPPHPSSTTEIMDRRDKLDDDDRDGESARPTLERWSLGLAGR